MSYRGDLDWETPKGKILSVMLYCASLPDIKFTDLNATLYRFIRDGKKLMKLKSRRFLIEPKHSDISTWMYFDITGLTLVDAKRNTIIDKHSTRNIITYGFSKYKEDPIFAYIHLYKKRLCCSLFHTFADSYDVSACLQIFCRENENKMQIITKSKKQNQPFEYSIFKFSKENLIFSRGHSKLRDDKSERFESKLSIFEGSWAKIDIKKDNGRLYYDGYGGNCGWSGYCWISGYGYFLYQREMGGDGGAGGKDYIEDCGWVE